MSLLSEHTDFHGTAEDVCQTFGIVPNPSKLLFLKTKAECEARESTIDVYVAEIPVKLASRLLSYLRNGVPGFNDVDVQHLRRFASGDHVPTSLRPASSTHLSDVPVECQSDVVLEDDIGQSLSNSLPAVKTATAYLLICPTSLISLPDLRKLFAQSEWYADSEDSSEIKVVQVPAVAPISQEQADQWSLRYWPTVYRKCNVYGPHPSIVARAEVEMLPNSGIWSALADAVAHESVKNGLGEAFGCVIIERKPGAEERVVVAAGDARWAPGKGTRKGTDKTGNLMGHAVMRAIGLVAKKRLRLARAAKSTAVPLSEQRSTADSPENPNELEMGEDQSRYFLDSPLTEIEQKTFEADTLAPNGYLCLDLEIYVTHEPCVMCSMAILHSRFGRCVFGRRMHLTGGLTPETVNETSSRDTQENRLSTGLGYGLSWRNDLNWRFLAWERMHEEKSASMKQGSNDIVHI